MTNEGARLNERYVSIVRWLVQRKILPEVIGETEGENMIVWHFEKIRAHYAQRRKRFYKFYSDQFGESDRKKGLLIDLMCEKIPLVGRTVRNKNFCEFNLLTRGAQSLGLNQMTLCDLQHWSKSVPSR